jgi:hypothetical protein
MGKVAGRGAPPVAAPPEASPGELVTICAECKQVISLRNSPGRPRLGTPDDETLVSHGICEACARRLYGPIFNRKG